MLVLDLSIISKTSSINSIKLTKIHHATKINNIVKYSRMLNTTNPLVNNLKSLNLETSLEKKKNQSVKKNSTKSDNTVKLTKGSRPKGRPPKNKNKNILSNSKTGSLDKFIDATSYLEYASSRSLQPNSGIFMGNLYELQVKTCLEESFKIRSTLHQGGSNDKGIDINAIWNPVEIFQKNIEESKLDLESKKKYEIVNSKKIKPLIKRTKQSLKLFVQCKCYDTSKIDPKLIREIKGSCQEYFNKNGNSAVFMIASTNGFTRTGQEDFDKATIPMIYAKFSKPKLINKKDPYKIENWEMGTLLGMYLNPVACALFKNLNWIKFSDKLST